MSVSYPVKIQVWSASGGHCCICKNNLIKDIKAGTEKSAQGEIAHIEGENDGAKRHNINQDEKARNSFPNLMLLCPSHHTEIDSDDITYTTEVLLKIKSEHEVWVNRQLAQASFAISFAELEVVLKYLSSNAIDLSYINFKLISPSEKISKNNLSSVVEDYITMGMIKTDLVREYLNRNPDVNFSNRLRKGFIEKYQELKLSTNGDELFYSMLNFASGSSSEFPNQAAALTVVVYFFQVCDIFEL
jgi:hypothetical protein